MRLLHCPTLALCLTGVAAASVALAQTWVAQSSGTTASLRGVSAVSPAVVWASGAGGAYLRTLDGGAIWHAAVVPGAGDPDFRSVRALDSHTAWLMSSGPGTKSRIYRTADGGAHWSPLYTNRDASGFFDALAFWDALRGVVLGDPVDGQFVILTTEDGGQTWQRRKLPPALPNEGAFAADISLVPVSFPYLERTFWLPARVTVHARYPGGELDSVHRYSDYLLYDDEADPEQKEKHAGVSPMTTPATENAWELLDRGISLAEENKPGEAMSTLREALRRNPEMPAAHFHLAAAMRATNDFAGAEAELREAVKLAPDSGPAHNFLGILLFKRGDVPDAITELRLGVQLQPKDATVHYNLAQALEKTGDRKAALDEYQTASTLAPDNVKIKARYEQLERAANAPPVAAAPGETTIKVEVRQVLVPVVVRDKEGHHVTGLTQADFRVFEDGVEQKISGFSVENAGVSSPPPPAAAASQPPMAAAPAPAPPKQVPVRRTYLVCIDALHTEFAHLVYIREALSKLFQSEKAGDAQYIVISVGVSTQVLENPTSDPESVLKAVDSKDFQKLFMASRKSSMEADMRSFRRTLDEARAACDAGDPACLPMKNRLPSEARQIAEQDRLYTVTFLSQFRSLIEQLRRGTGRRTIILFSDGFQLVPGQLAFELLSAYFPEISGISLRTVDRMPDMEPVLQLAANSNIPIYTIDSRGLYTFPYFDASNSGGVARLAPAVLSAMNSNATEAGQTLSEIAAATGGTAFHNSNNILNGLQRAFADGREYYMLAYVPGNFNLDGKFRAISVRVRDSKLAVNAKRGYWATGTSH